MSMTDFQGVWFPTHFSADGRTYGEWQPTFPPPREPWVLTVIGDRWHITAAHEYYATGGYLRVDRAARVLTFDNPLISGEHADINPSADYRLEGDELLVQYHQSRWTGGDPGMARYVRVACAPTAEMWALIEPSETRLMQRHGNNNGGTT